LVIHDKPADIIHGCRLVAQCLGRAIREIGHNEIEVVGSFHRVVKRKVKAHG